MKQLILSSFTGFLIAFFILQSVAHTEPLCKYYFAEVSDSGKKALSAESTAVTSTLQQPLVLSAHDFQYLSSLSENDLNKDSLFRKKFALASPKNKLLTAIFALSASLPPHGNLSDSLLSMRLRDAFPIDEQLFTAELNFNLNSSHGSIVKQKLQEIIEANMHYLANGMSVLHLPFLAKLIRMENSTQSKIYFDQILDYLNRQQRNTYEFQDIERSVLENFTENSLRRLFNLDYKKQIQFFVTSSGVRVLSTDLIDALSPIPNLNPTFIFSSYDIKSSESPTFSFNNKVYEVEFSTDLNAVRPMYRKSEKFNVTYTDGEYGGAILIGIDMSEPLELAKEYKRYYESRGFTFKKMYVQKSFAKKFSNQVRDGQIGYFLKEDNGSGFISDNPRVLEGQKRTAKGVERIQIVVSEHMKYLELDFAIGKTEVIELANSAGNKDLVYVDTTCYSCERIAGLAPHVTNPNFRFIAPLKIAETFTFEKSTPLLHLLDGIRKGETFVAVSDRMKKNKVVDESTGQNDNEYLFPNEKKYKKFLSPTKRSGAETKYFIKENKAVIQSGVILGESVK